MATIDEVLKSSLKKYDLRVAPLTSIAEDVQAYKTGNIAIDHIIGVGGLPVGRSIELFGPNSSGKTTTALQCAVQLQRLILVGGNADPTKGPIVAPTDRIVYFDYEHATDPVYCKSLGLDIEHPSFLFAQPESLEQGANVAKQLIETGELRLLIWDSVAAAVPSAKAEAEIGKSLPAVAAKLYSDFTSSLNEPLHRNNCTALFLNHIMEVMSMGGRPGMPPLTSTPGGRALKFYASVRIEYRQAGQVKEKYIDPLTKEEIEQVTATNVRVKVVKNKVGAPFRQAVVRVRYGKGFDNFWTALQILVAHKKIPYSAGYFYFEKCPHLIHVDMDRQSTGNKRPYIRGEKAIFAFADARPDWREQVIEYATEIVSEDVSVLDEITSPDDDDPMDSAIEAEATDGLVQVDPKTGLVIDEEELKRLTSFIPSMGVNEDVERILKSPIKISKPTKQESEDAKFTEDLLSEI